MISRKDTVNISNMPIASEEPYPPQSQLEEGSWMAKKFASLADPSQWKITKFETTPPVGPFSLA